MTVATFDTRPCALGEGPLWHPERGQLFWFDITGRRLLTRQGDEAQEWVFDAEVSAAGWIDRDRLLIASARELFAFHLETGARTHVCPLEADNPVTRSNDGRADPQGGFWIGTMGRDAEPGAGAIYRWYRGTLRRLHGDITVPNAICFSPDGKTAFFADTLAGRIMAQPLDAEGWPSGDARTHIDLRTEDLAPDGAVVDSEGCLWNAQWGAARVARYAPDGRFLSAIPLPASLVTCPAFDGSTLYVTSAAGGAPEGEAAAGHTFRVETTATGQKEHRIAWPD